MPEHELTSRVTASASHIIDDSLEDWICRHCSKKSAYRGIGQPRQFTSAMALTDEVEISASTSAPLHPSASYICIHSFFYRFRTTEDLGPSLERKIKGTFVDRPYRDI